MLKVIALFSNPSLKRRTPMRRRAAAAYGPMSTGQASRAILPEHRKRTCPSECPFRRLRPFGSYPKANQPDRSLLQTSLALVLTLARQCEPLWTSSSPRRPQHLRIAHPCASYGGLCPPSSWAALLFRPYPCVRCPLGTPCFRFAVIFEAAVSRRIPFSAGVTRRRATTHPVRRTRHDEIGIDLR